MNRKLPRIWVMLAALVLVGSLAACSGPEDREAALGMSPTVDPGDPIATLTVVPSGGTTATVEVPGATATAGVPTVGIEDSATVAPTASVTDTAPPSTATDAPTATVVPSPEGSVLPGSRIVSFYGHPNSQQMGVLGESDLDTIAARLRDQAAAYQAADPSHPVIPAFEIIASVAQPEPGDDGTYLSYTGDDVIQPYADYAAANGMLLILDLQIGHSTVHDEITRIDHWLQLPYVHVALDPEFSTGPDRVPGQFIGEVDGSRVQVAVEYLSQLVQQYHLPSKILIVHQFEEEMILNKSLITPLPGVDIVIDMDGFGEQDAKIQNYQQFVHDQLIEYGGIKLFYKQDNPLLTPEQVVALDPAPLVVIYQ